MGVGLTIEYCSACRWMLRGTWIASELLTTFANEPGLACVTLIPRSPPLSGGGIFRVCAHPHHPGDDMMNIIIDGCDVDDDDDDESSGVVVDVLWDRKATGRFPEAKEVKQRVRDRVSPSRDLGHSDVVDSVGSRVAATTTKNNDDDDLSSSISDGGKGGVVDCVECKEEQRREEEDGRTTTTSEPPRITTIVGAEGRGDGDGGGEGGRKRGRPDDPTIPPAFFRDRNRVSIEYSAGGGDRPDDNGLNLAAYYANELLVMTYERNAWWKKRMEQQQRRVEGGGRGGEDDEGEEDIDTQQAPPVVVDSVSLIPRRLDRWILVSLLFSFCRPVSA